MTNKQKRLIENYIRLKVKKVLNEGHDGNEVLDQSIRTLDQITSMLSNLQRDLYALSKNPDNRDISDKIIKIINPFGKLADQVLFKLEDLDEKMNPIPGRGLT